MPLDILPGSYCGAAAPPGLALWRWNLDPVLILGLLTLLWALRRAPTGPAAVGVLALVFVSPLCAVSVGLFSARVVHHVALVAVAAPLLALALPARRPAGPALPFLVSTALLWAWHLPAAYDLALRDMAAYWAMQATLLGSAVWFWRSVLGARSSLDAVLWTLAGLMQMGALGAILTFAPAPLYAAHGLAPLDWGLTPLADQQLGGLIMWVPAMLPYAVLIAWQARRGWRDAALGRPA